MNCFVLRNLVSKYGEKVLEKDGKGQRYNTVEVTDS